MTIASISTHHHIPLVAATTEISDLDSRMAKIKSEVLETVRSYMPIEALFTPELKIDLGVFIKDQILIRRIAEFLHSLIGHSPLDKTSIISRFEEDSLFNEIKALFRQDPSPYLSLLYDCFVEVCNHTDFPPHPLTAAVEGRIFTLKNALVAQYNPEAILANQRQHKIPPQDLHAIQEEGSHFLKNALRIHLQGVRGQINLPFRTVLTSTAEQLASFVRKITSFYLNEQGKTCSEDPLTWRNPTGYNHHGLVAATVMEVALQTLGYKTRLRIRSDLEPRVTLAITHSIVELEAPDHSLYLINPSYRQFYKDIYPDALPLPSQPVLVLQENEVDSYIENTFVAQWRARFTLLNSGDKASREQMISLKQILAFTINTAGIPQELIPPDLESWIRGAFKRIFGLPGYSTPLSNRCLQEIFHHYGDRSGTYEYVKPMGLEALMDHPSTAEVERQLALCSSVLKRKNDPRVLSLIAMLPGVKRTSYASFMNIDTRITGIPLSLNAYFRSLKKIVNPEGRDKTVVYGCSGADCTTVLLATDASDFIFVDLTKLSFEEFSAALMRLKSTLDPLAKYLLKQELEKSDQFISVRANRAGASSQYVAGLGKHVMRDLPLKIFFDLQEAGVDLDTITLSSLPKQGIALEFPWQYFGEIAPRKRKITLVTADITDKETYPSLLKAKLVEGIDIFYMKAAFFAPLKYPQFLPHIGASLRPGGWLMTADKTWIMEAINPEECLSSSGLTFTLHKSEESSFLETISAPAYDPLCSLTSLERFSSQEARPQRMPSTDESYWSVLNLRQKV